VKLHRWKLQSNVGFNFFDLNVIDVLLATFLKSITTAIPKGSPFLRYRQRSVVQVGVDVLSELSEQGNISIFGVK
jgi:hypothetical protein